MQFKLTFDAGIIDGADVRRILEYFPEIESSFTARKTYDEYYCEEQEVDITDIDVLSKLGYIHVFDNEITVITR